MNWVLLFLSIILESSKNVFSNNFSKNVLKSDTDIYKFNMFLYIGSFVVLLFFGNTPISGYTCVVALAFSAVTAASQYYLVKALHVGPMSFTSFIQGSSLVIPALFGTAFLGEKVSVVQIVSLPILIFAMALVLNVKKGKMNKKWMIFAFLAMLSTGLIGVIQTIHQTSQHSGELIGFLRMTFLYAVLFNCMFWRIGERKTPACFSIKSNAIVQAAASGIFMGAVNIINLHLTGVMPKIIFFPIVNGGLIIATLLAAVVFFKERLNKKQWVGIIVGIVAMCLIGL